jgi:hypothetical protein
MGEYCSHDEQKLIILWIVGVGVTEYGDGDKQVDENNNHSDDHINNKYVVFGIGVEYSNINGQKDNKQKF